jgi:DMSO/TMAO reductase YedYZ molybdopterin-dependent catalytic subunit
VTDDAPRGKPIGRRVLLGSIGLGALGVLFGARVQSTTARWLLPVTLHDPTGLSDLIPAAGRFRIYSVTGSLPHRTDDEYRLTVDGAVARPASFTMTDLRSGLPQAVVRRDFQCVTGWRVEDVDWAGVRLRDVLDVAGVGTAATHVVLHSFDGTYTETLSLDQARRDDVLVAHTLQGEPLGRQHGGPARLYVAPMYGYKSLKWLERIEVVTVLDDDTGYWEQRGFDRDAWVGSSNGGQEDPT